MMLDREELARKIVEVSRDHADGYRRNISQFNTAHENEVAERCATAASNTGWFLLKALGYSDDEIKVLYNLTSMQRRQASGGV
jgi:hypothetical protein